jgi:hypothetical protein
MDKTLIAKGQLAAVLPEETVVRRAQDAAELGALANQGVQQVTLNS